MNTFGKNLRITTFGESHGPAMGGVIDGFPSGFRIDFEMLQKDLDERKPGSSDLTTPRKESDTPEFLSGISPEGITLGTPIGFIIRNRDTKSSDYDEMAKKYRPNHADYTYMARYGIRDHRGGGRASARETVNWVVSGALAKQWLNSENIRIQTVLSAVKDVNYIPTLKQRLINNPTGCDLEVPDDIKSQMEEQIRSARAEGDSVAGAVTCLITGLKAGIGDPVFGKLNASIASAMMGINAAKGFEYGCGMDVLNYSGLQSADIFYSDEDGKILTKTNFSGGIQGGISNGMPIFFTVYFKATPTVMKELPTLDIDGNETSLKGRGRHDPCVAVRAVPVVKAMAALVIADFLV